MGGEQAPPTLLRNPISQHRPFGHYRRLATAGEGRDEDRTLSRFARSAQLLRHGRPPGDPAHEYQARGGVQNPH